MLPARDNQVLDGFTMRILIYGDSNSWGFLDDGSGIRHAKRWPVIMAEALHKQSKQHQAIELIEESLPGRTTAFPDPKEGPEYNGLPYLRPALLSHAPIDWVLIMLGTNDCKLRFAASAEMIATQTAQLARMAKRAPVGRGKWREASSPHVGVICPAPIGMRADDPKWPRYAEWKGGRTKTLELPDALRAALDGSDIPLFFAGEAVTPSNKDPIHLDADSHKALGLYVANCLMDHI